MSSDHRIKDLSEQIANSPDDAESQKLAQELQETIHERVEELREKNDAMTLIRTVKANSGR